MSSDQEQDRDCNSFPVATSFTTLSSPAPWNAIIITMLNAPWYIPNTVLHTDLLISTVREEVTKHGTTHKDKLIGHPNQLIPILLEEQGPKRLKRYNPNDLTHRFS